MMSPTSSAGKARVELQGSRSYRHQRKSEERLVCASPCFTFTRPSTHACAAAAAAAAAADDDDDDVDTFRQRHSSYDVCVWL